MKRIIIILIVLALFAVGAYYFFLQITTQTPQKCEDGFRFDPAQKKCVVAEIPKPVVKELDLSLVEIQVPESSIKITLQKGSKDTYSNTYIIDPKISSSKGFISINPKDAISFSDTLVLIPMLVDSGGTGQFNYIALFNKKENKHISSIFVGDRIGIQDIQIVNQLAKINFKTRSISQSFADQPTIPAQIVVDVQETGMTQIMRLENSDYNQVEIKNPAANSDVSGEFMVKGSMPGYWYFEAVAQFKIIDENYNEIAIGSIQSLSDWMTEQRVPFELKLNTVNFNYKGKATIIIQSENTQGGLEGELKVKKMEVPVVIR